MIRVGIGLLIVGVSFAVTAFACGAPPPPSGGSAPPPPSERQPSPESTPSEEQWELSFAQEGGIAGLSRTAVISSTGQAVFRDRQSGRESQVALTEPELRQLGELLEASDFFAQEEDQRTPACRDCITYTLVLRRGVQTHQVHADDPGMSEQLWPLIEWLVERTNRALP